jgi:hypothetical protein
VELITWQHQQFIQSGYGNHTSIYSNESSIPAVNYQPPAVSFVQPQWQPHHQLSSSAPASYAPNALYSDISQVQQQPPAFYPHVSYPLSAPPVHQQLLQPVNVGLEDARTCLPFKDQASSSSFIPPTRQTPKEAQQKTSIALEPATEWAQRVADVQRPERINPFQSSYRNRPMLIPKIGESEPRLYRPLPSRSGVPATIGRTSKPPVGSEEDLIARLVSILAAGLFFSLSPVNIVATQALERRFQVEEGRRALRREKRKQSAVRRESNEDDWEIPVKKQKIRKASSASREESLSGPGSRLQTIASRPAAKPKPLARTRSCPSVSNLMKAVLRL